MSSSGGNSKSPEDEEHAEFLFWLKTLDRSQLLNAMEFSFREDAQSNSSHEYDLLAEMVQMQSNPPTPIHPRAVFYKPASGKGKTDGRNEAARVFRNRIKRPRFFRFFESKSIAFAGGPFGGNLPSLAASAGASTGGRRRVGAGNNRQERNRATAAASRQQRYEITARKFVTAWGDILSVGYSEESRAADENLLSYSVLDKGDATEQPTARIYMSFCATSKTKTAADVVRLLKVASRGNFLTSPHQNRQNTTSKDIPAFCAPWLDPTSRWFSLPMYLASRFEVALWESFKDNRRVVVKYRNRPWDNLEEKLTQAVIERTISKALLDTLRKDVIGREMYTTRAPALSLLRDGMLFDLVEATEFWRAKEIFFVGECSSTWSSIKRFVRGISCHPVIELGTTTDKLRECFRQHLKVELSAQIGKELLTSYGSETSSNKSAQTGGKLSRRSRKKKPKKKNGRKRQVSKDNEQKTATFTNDKEGGSSDDESDSNPPLTHADGNRRLSFPDNGTPFVERNRNIVMCLSTLNDIVNEVFRRDGLEVSSDESDSPVVGSKQPKIAPPKAKSQPKATHKQPRISCKQPRTHADTRQHEGPREEKKSNQSNEIHARFPSRESEGDFSSLNDPIRSADTFPSQYTYPESFFVRTVPFQSNPWHVYHNNNDDDDDDGDGWGRSNRFPSRERSILTEFFIEQELADAHRLERITASFTAASLASSTDKNNEDTLSISDICLISLDNGSEAPASGIASDIASTGVSAEEFPALGVYPEEHTDSHELLEEDTAVQGETEAEADVKKAANPEYIDEKITEDVSHRNIEARSVTPEAPATPSPRLSPILLSLDDLRDIRTGTKSVGNGDNLAQGASASVPSSLPSSPVDQSKRRLRSSRSRENLRVKSFRDDHEFVRSYRRNRTVEESLTYRNVAAGSANVKARATRSVSSDSFRKAPKRESRSAFMPRKTEPTPDNCTCSENEVELRDESQNSSGGALSYRNVAAKSVKSVFAGSFLRNGADRKFASLGKDHQPQRELCARSETAIEGHEDYQNLHDSRRSLPDNPDNITVGGKDGSTTITSAMSHRESEETSNLREERNTFRDMCLTLGAEVAKLKNQLAAQQAYPAFDYTQGYVQPTLFGAASFDPECMPPFFQKGQAVGAMSDAGVHRGEYESQFSEDEDQFGKVAYAENGRRLSSGHTLAGSDVSIEPTSSSHALQGPVGLPAPLSKDSHGAGTGAGLQTRLTQDIFRFVASTDIQHRKLDRTRNAAVERMTRLVNTLWPRAQVKVYGSHVTALCLPSSDLDFVICLPAVHKNAPAVAPGVLEGRNAINETSQKLLARKLKGESWIDPRSMKLIERTVVPVIKVATKDTRARTVQLDISFDSTEHHGLEAVVMVKQIMEDLPMIRPLVLVLKQFLLDRALLTAYTGGLSSYCLFLMVARYLQEQPSSWVDCGSLLMGFLDFYGNCFDPRCTGISVGRRQYFTRPNYAATQGQAAGQHMWAGVSPSPAVIPSPASAARGNTDFYRRNSFGENRSVDGLRGATGSPHIKSPRFQSHGGARYGTRMPPPAVHVPVEVPMDHAMPFTFDPLFVDDPLSYGNNVGRNAFRIFQVQRAFSDAHRALVASLEWDIQSTGDLHENNDYPLLKCLLQSEDVFYEV